MEWLRDKQFVLEWAREKLSDSKGLLKYAPLVVAGGLVVRWYMKKLPIKSPGFGIPLIGHLHHIAFRQHEAPVVMEEWFNKLGAGTVGVQLYTQPYLFTRDPAVVRQFMSDPTHFDKGDVTLAVLKPMMGDGIFAVNGEQWQQQRSAALPLFHPKSLQDWVPVMVEQARSQQAKEFVHVLPGQPMLVDIQALARRYTLGTFLEMGVGLKLSEEEMKDFGAAFDHLNYVTTERYVNPMKRVLPLLPSFRRSLRSCYRLIEKAITERHAAAARPQPTAHDVDLTVVTIEEAPEHPDVMSRFSALTTPQRRKELLDVIMNFIIAGRDTTAALIAHCSWMLAIHPDVQARVVAELRAAGLLDEAAPLTYANLTALSYTKSVLMETLRLFPSVPVDGYDSKEGATLVVEGRTIRLPKGTPCFYTSYSMHRQEQYFGPRPKEFNPDRWATIRPPSFAYIPFHAGPRSCLGRDLAYLEAKAFLTMFLRRYELRPAASTPPTIGAAKMLHSIILGVDGGIPVLVSRRAEAAA